MKARGKGREEDGRAEEERHKTEGAEERRKGGRDEGGGSERVPWQNNKKHGRALEGTGWGCC